MAGKLDGGLRNLDRGTKQTIEILLRKLPEDCSLEDVQYHLYVLTKVLMGLEIAESQGTVTQNQAEQELSKCLIQ
ncbi:MAG: hypothetical protein WCA35_00480 [Kovacikia sp.]